MCKLYNYVGTLRDCKLCKMSTIRERDTHSSPLVFLLCHAEYTDTPRPETDNHLPWQRIDLVPLGLEAHAVAS